MRALALVAGTLLLAACAQPFPTFNIPPGASRDDVIARSGPPTAVVPLPNGGQRLQYSLQPRGQYAYMVDLDAAGRVVQVRQVLNANDFYRIEADRWTRDDVAREFGPPAQIDRVYSWNGPIWTYRWKDTAGSDMFYWVYFDPQGVVRRSHPGMEFFGPKDSRS